jgi:hypothetical protein
LIGHDGYNQGMRHRWLGLIPAMIGLMLRGLFDKQLAANIAIPNRSEGMERLRGFLESGQLTPAIDSRYPLEKMPEAMRHLQTADLNAIIKINGRTDIYNSDADITITAVDGVTIKRVKVRSTGQVTVE